MMEETVFYLLKERTCKSFIIYLHKNILNDKVYIGQTSKSLKERWREEGSGYLRKTKKGFSQPKFAAAILKYGWNNFEHRILAIVFNEQLADRLEKAFIKKYDSVKNGYNLSSGGNLTHSHSKETKEKIANSNKGKKMSEDAIQKRIEKIKGRQLSEVTKKKISKGNLGKKRKPRSEEYKKKLSKSLKNKFQGKNNPFFGKTHSEEIKKKYFNRKVLCIETNEIFDSIKQAMEKYNFKGRSSISNVCNNKQKTAYGLTWKYLEEKPKKNFSEESIKKIKKANSKKVVCVETGEAFQSAAEVGRKLSLFNGSSITKCCLGQKQKVKNFHWKYLER